MSGYLKNVVYKGTFDGDEVTVTMRPMELVDTLKFSTLSENMPMKEFLPIVLEVLPRYVTEITGLKDKAGAPITKEEVMTAAYFSRLVTDCCLELLASAKPANP